MEERRKFVRLDLNTGVNWRKDDEASDRTIYGKSTTKNISGGGVCLIMDQAVKIGDKLHLEIELPTKKIIYSEGVVIWVEKFEIIGGRYEKRYDAGVEFSEITDEDREEIKKFVFRILHTP